METVSIIASGYEWDCPRCGNDHQLSAYPRNQFVQCECCEQEYQLDLPDHARE